MHCATEDGPVQLFAPEIVPEQPVIASLASQVAVESG